MVYARKVDQTQKEIVEGLRAAGFRVEIIGRPVDLLVGEKGTEYNHRKFYWTLMELKTPTKAGKVRKRADQEAQQKFCEETGTCIVSSLDEALNALGIW